MPFCLRSEEHTSELQSPQNLVCRLLLEKKKKQQDSDSTSTRRRPVPLTAARHAQRESHAGRAVSSVGVPVLICGCVFFFFFLNKGAPPKFSPFPPPAPFPS